MNKKILCIAATMLLLVQANAQSIKTFVEGKTITKLTKTDMTISSEMMGQTMEQQMQTTNTIEMKVVAARDKEMKVQQKTTKMTMNMSVMGQEIDFDSEKTDNDEKLSSMKDAINKVAIITTDEKGIVTDMKYDKELEALMQGNAALTSTSAKGMPLDFIVLLPTDVAIGKTWTQVFGTEGKDSYTYTVKSIDNGVAQLELTGKLTVNATSQANGMDMLTKLSGKVAGLVSVDAKTNLVKSRTSKTEFTGTVEVMGQSMPMQTTMTTEETYK